MKIPTFLVVKGRLDDAQLMAASKSAQPERVIVAAVVSPRNNPTRRAGAFIPTIAAPLSYAKIAAFVASEGTVAILSPVVAGLPHVREFDPETAAVPSRPPASAFKLSEMATLVWLAIVPKSVPDVVAVILRSS